MCSINMRGGVRGEIYATCHHVKSLATTSSRPNPETLVAREVLAHPCVVFHPCACGLCRGAAEGVVALIGYGGTRSLLGQGRGGFNRLLLLH
jgi:hypothetical protein